MSDLYYDPWAVDIDLDPYPTYQRLRDEQPLYYNERHDFWGLSRYTDVDTALRDAPAQLCQGRHPRSRQGRSGDAAGRFHQRGPPLHTIHRAIVGPNVHSEEDACARG